LSCKKVSQENTVVSNEKPCQITSSRRQFLSYMSSRAAPIPIHLSNQHDVSTRTPLPCSRGRDSRTFSFSKGHTMNSNQKSGNKQSGIQGGTPEQHAEAGRQSHKNDANRQSASSGGSGAGGASGGRSASSGSGSGTRGGTPEQHAEAGRQSHKNDGKK
jgi:hypothetical protein